MTAAHCIPEVDLPEETVEIVSEDVIDVVTEEAVAEEATEAVAEEAVAEEAVAEEAVAEEAVAEEATEEPAAPLTEDDRILYGLELFKEYLAESHLFKDNVEQILNAVSDDKVHPNIIVHACMKGLISVSHKKNCRDFGIYPDSFKAVNPLEKSEEYSVVMDQLANMTTCKRILDNSFFVPVTSYILSGNRNAAVDAETHNQTLVSILENSSKTKIIIDQNLDILNEFLGDDTTELKKSVLLDIVKATGVILTKPLPAEPKLCDFVDTLFDLGLKNASIHLSREIEIMNEKPVKELMDITREVEPRTYFLNMQKYIDTHQSFAANACQKLSEMLMHSVDIKLTNKSIVEIIKSTLEFQFLLLCAIRHLDQKHSVEYSKVVDLLLTGKSDPVSADYVKDIDTVSQVCINYTLTM